MSWRYNLWCHPPLYKVLPCKIKTCKPVICDFPICKGICYIRIDFIREISDAIHNLSFSQNFVCKTTLEENLPPIFIDSLRLKQALINLLKNSYEAMGETGTVILNVFRKDDFIDIELTDFGGGIPDTTKDNLFEIFTTSKEYGTGLGLPIAEVS